MDRPPLPLITPMAPTLIAQPFHRDGWVYGTLMLDGEVAVLDPSLISRFEWLRGRPKSETATPAIYMALARGRSGRPSAHPPCAAPRQRRDHGLGGSARARLRGHGREGSGVALPRRPDPLVAEGEAAEPAPPKPREALKTAIRPPEQRPRDNWVVRIFDFLVRIAWRLLWSWRR